MFGGQTDSGERGVILTCKNDFICKNYQVSDLFKMGIKFPRWGRKLTRWGENLQNGHK